MEFETVKCVVKICPPTLQEEEDGAETIVEVFNPDLLQSIYGNGKEKEEVEDHPCRIVAYHPESKQGLLYKFDYVFDQDVQNEMIFNKVCEDYVDKVLKGYNCSLISYGPSKTGKTQLFYGSKDYIGLVSLCVQKCFKELFPQLGKYLLETYVSFWEMNSNDIIDLLQPLDRQREKRFVIHRDGKTNQKFIKNLSFCSIDSFDQFEELVKKGTRFSNYLSLQRGIRWHNFLKLTFIRTDKKNPQYTIQSSIYFINLKGTDRMGELGAKKQLVKESSSINKSMTAFGNTIHNIVSYCRKRVNSSRKRSRNQHKKLIVDDRVPLGGSSRRGHVAGLPSDKTQKDEKIQYEDLLLDCEREKETMKDLAKKLPRELHSVFGDSKLTLLLSDVFVGNYYTLMICSISPTEYHYLETVNCLENLRVANHIPIFPKFGRLKNTEISSLFQEIQKMEKKLESKDLLAPGHPPTEEEEELMELRKEFRELVSEVRYLEDGEFENDIQKEENIKRKERGLGFGRFPDESVQNKSKQTFFMPKRKAARILHNKMKGKTTESLRFGGGEKNKKKKKNEEKKKLMNQNKNKNIQMRGEEFNEEMYVYSYDGDWKNGEKEGFGTIVTKTYKYQGYWKNDQKHGKLGILWSKEPISKKLNSSSSTTKTNQKSQQQTRKRKSKNITIGSILRENGQHLLLQQENGKIASKKNQQKTKRGQSKKKNKKKNGSAFVYERRYKGQWKYDRKHGRGILYERDGSIYVGEFQNDRQEGKGVLYHIDGSKHTGEYSKGKANGYGILEMKNGDLFKGYFFNGKKHGPGLYYYESSNQVYRGEWVDGSPKTGEISVLPSSSEEEKEEDAFEQMGNVDMITTASASPFDGSALPLPVCELEKRVELIHESVKETRKMGEMMMKTAPDSSSSSSYEFEMNFNNDEEMERILFPFGRKKKKKKEEEEEEKRIEEEEEDYNDNNNEGEEYSEEEGEENMDEEESEGEEYMEEEEEEKGENMAEMSLSFAEGEEEGEEEDEFAEYEEGEEDDDDELM